MGRSMSEETGHDTAEWDAAITEIETYERGADWRAERWEALWDIVQEMMERPCENGNDCRPKVEFQHPCVTCLARMEWEAR